MVVHCVTVRSHWALGLKVRSHGAAAAAIFLPQQMGCIGLNVSVHTAAATVPQVNGFFPIFGHFLK